MNVKIAVSPLMLNNRQLINKFTDKADITPLPHTVGGQMELSIPLVKICSRE
jgi:hypothetical protein